MIRHDLEAVKAINGKEPLAVMAKMRETPVNDFMSENATLRIDGRVVLDMYLFEVKKPAEFKYPWDYCKQLRVVPGGEAFNGLTGGGRPLDR